MFKFTELIPGPDQSPTLQTMATSLSMIAYSFVIVLLVDCTRRLLKADYIQSKWMKPFLFLYLIIMVLLSTLTVVQETVYISKDGKPDSTSRLTGTSQPAVLFGIFDVPISLPFTIWGADIFMIWRCAMIYQTTPPSIQAGVACVLFILSLISLGGGIFFFLQPVYSIVNGVVFIVIMTTAANIVLSSLITGRILYYERRVRKSLGVFNDPAYKRAVTICVESCALIVVVSVLFVILYYADTHSAFLFPLVLLPHVCVISPMLIISRVAQGRGTTTMNLSQIQTPNITSQDMEARPLAPIQFNTSTASPSTCTATDRSTASIQNSAV
ncbi:hypothetical protein CVT25_012472 [Psilocybe cyanescens]|uniref:G-protein coupled receptors family 1 profile domain-containing protein n=1 Tax=Psilocybe cyanescens TaxID=93625 RepID=A0A409XHE8_PSICY|nr:hypothetical protein CVT25_012472 [Psilocybe cyanescens]